MCEGEGREQRGEAKDGGKIETREISSFGGLVRKDHEFCLEPCTVLTVQKSVGKLLISKPLPRTLYFPMCLLLKSRRDGGQGQRASASHTANGFEEGWLQSQSFTQPATRRDCGVCIGVWESVNVFGPSSDRQTVILQFPLHNRIFGPFFFFKVSFLLWAWRQTSMLL